MKRMTDTTMRRTFSFLPQVIVLFLQVVGAAVAIAADEQAAAEPAAARPNILFAFADDWGRYASAYADVDGRGTDGRGSVNDAIATPAFDRVAREGVLFRNAFVTAPSCTPCRSSLLSGQYFFRTGRGAILQGAVWNDEIPTYPLQLREAGYHIGYTYKVWTPGTPPHAPYGARRYAYNGRGAQFNRFSQRATESINDGATIREAKERLIEETVSNFNDFLASRPNGAPFCYWFGPTNAHRKWVKGSGKTLWGIDPDQLKGKLPKFLPDVAVVREDFSDYLGEVMAFDAALERLLQRLHETGELDNTLVVVSGDHGAPGFPRGKCNLYDFGTAVPLAVRFPKSVPAGRVLDDFVNLMDLAPTFLEACGVDRPSVMTGKSLMPILSSTDAGQVDPARDFVITGRERHVAAARAGQLPYPQRALRTKDYLYIVNFEPSRFPMGDPMAVTAASIPSAAELANDTFVAFPDMDASPTKAWLVEHRKTERTFYEFAFGKRPRHELYSVSDDPDQLRNLADDPAFGRIRKSMHDRLLSELERLGDPRVTGDGKTYERPPFAGG